MLYPQYYLTTRVKSSPESLNCTIRERWRAIIRINSTIKSKNSCKIRTTFSEQIDVFT
jgi:hypothetical protein